MVEPVHDRLIWVGEIAVTVKFVGTEGPETLSTARAVGTAVKLGPKENIAMAAILTKALKRVSVFMFTPFFGRNTPEGGNYFLVSFKPLFWPIWLLNKI